MGKVKQQKRPKKPGTLKFAFAKYMVLCLAVATGLTLFTIWAAEEISWDLYGDTGVAASVCIVLIPILCVGSVVAASVLFYNRKLRRPMAILDAAAANIAANNLDFTVCYTANNELGRLCDSFEKMRASLLESNREMWRQMEERRRLNAAFSHDLRTPLTVLKGETEMLEKYVPEGRMDGEKVLATATIMRAHITRLENYVSTMNSLQRLEDITVNRRTVSSAEVAGRISYCAGMLSQQKAIVVNAERLTAPSLSLDMDLVMQVFENLVSNALRFAAEGVEVVLAGTGVLILSVQDDGPGFHPDDLPRVSDPFFQATGQEKEEHFGMGLSICKVLCEKHGGSLTVENVKGARVTAVFSGK